MWSIRRSMRLGCGGSGWKVVEICSEQTDDKKYWTQINAENADFFSESASIRVNQRPIFYFTIFLISTKVVKIHSALAA